MRFLKSSAGPLLSFASLAAASIALSGCWGYSSEYVPLDDGRARAVYQDDKLVMQVGGGVPAECEQEVVRSRGADVELYGRGGVSTSVWVPVYYGPRIVVVHQGVAPLPPRRTTSVGSSSSHLSGFNGGSLGSGTGGGGGSSSGGGGGGNLDLKEGIVVVAVLALIALPAISIGLALGRPEPEQEVAEVIDRVNIFNDTARAVGGPCAVIMASAPQAGGVGTQ